MAEQNDSVLCAAIRSLGADPENILDSLTRQRTNTFGYLATYNRQSDTKDICKILADQSLVINELLVATGRKEVNDGC